MALKIGITGGIGSGKSFVSKLFIERGVPVFDTDTVAKELTNTDDVIRTGLVALLGSDVYIGEHLNKRLLADYLFASPDNARQVNAIIHPRVYEAFREWEAACVVQGQTVVAMESAILYESGFHRFVDKVVVVTAPLEVRIRRVMLRDGVLREEVERRIRAQQSDEDKIARADFVILNDGNTNPANAVDEVLTSFEMNLLGR